MISDDVSRTTISESRMKGFDMDIRTFDTSVLSLDKTKAPIVVLIGRRNTGKTTVIQHVMKANRNFLSDKIVVNAKEGFSKEYSRSLASSADKQEASPYGVTGIFEEFEDKIIKNVIHRTRSNNHKHTCLVLDDCIYDQNAWRSTPLQNIFMNGRHLRVMMLMAMQYPLGLPPKLRTNIDFVFLFRENNISNRKRIYENYAGMFPTFELFCNMMDKYTQNNDALVLRNSSISNRLDECVFWYKGTSVPDVATHSTTSDPTIGNKRARTE